MEIDKAKVIHFIGIGGCGMSAIAKILKEMGMSVQGSDSKESPNTIRLKDIGIKVFIGHKAINVRGADLVVYSSAIPKENNEMKAAKADKLKLIPRAEALSWIMDQFPIRIAIAGTHGKTTTTSMVTTVLTRSGLDPTFLIGAEADTVTGNAKLGEGKEVVAEADESDGSFLLLHPTISVITNIEADHMEHYRTISKLLSTFETFAKALPEKGRLIINSDYKNTNKLLEKLPKNINVMTFGLNGEAELRAENISFNKTKSTFEVNYKNKSLGEVEISVPGAQNVLNALSTIAVGLQVGVPFEEIANSIRYFKGVKRRFQHIGSYKGIMVVDDYAHHPTEVAATLKAAKSGWSGQKKIIFVFQPHRYTRTMFLHEQFGDSFGDADEVIITDIYSAGEEPIDGVSAKMIVDAAMKKIPGKLHYIPKKDKIVDHLMKTAKEGAMIITAGAGDIHTVGKELLTRLRAKQ